MKASLFNRCGCKDATTGKPLDYSCPQLSKRRHGSHGFVTRIDTTNKGNRRLRRAAFDTQKKAEEAFDHVKDLIKLARDDSTMRRKIADLIFTLKRGAPSPASMTSAETRP
ncbi:hypothetical protein C1I98_02885 [Spongiactinospora gelatinilytica]|uniref:AP2-like integrase N-terminal domain-containing protein n=1 Tax=Spongiactinospora gelatinilytica TaxID=2666298 RepID=A0A2W2H4V3_9ACTN|nr:hypothetical protein [Spongiactinospora gelatinilytica]PZG55651.1 hypothetical protein C1I98_02885 [Spongiactinospora gelatinilytica]